MGTTSRFQPAQHVVWAHSSGNPRLYWKIVAVRGDYYMMEKVNGTNVGHREQMLVAYVDGAYEPCEPPKFAEQPFMISEKDMGVDSQ